MTDTSSLIPNTIGVSDDCKYVMKSSSARARSYRASIAPTNKSTFAPQDQMIFYIPGGRRNTYLDCTQSYIRYTVKNNESTATNNINFDNCGASVLNRLDVFHSSNLLESVQQYNVLYNYLIDFTLNPAQRVGLSSMYGNSTGQTTCRQGQQIGIGGYATVCMPILSGVVGVGADKMLPLGRLNDDIRMEFTLESQNVGMVYVNSPLVAWSIISAELELCIVELSDEGESLVRGEAPISQPVYLHGNSWRHYVSSLPASSGGYSTLVPARFASLSSLVCLPRRSTEIANSAAYGTASRVNPNFAQYWWRIGSALIPQKSVNLENTNTTGGYAEAFAEIQRAFHSLDTPGNASSLIFSNYNISDQSSNTLTGVTAVSGGASSYGNAFAIAQELESFAQRSDLLLSGMNTLSSQVFFECNINTAPSVTYQLDFFANYSHILVIDTNGIISVKF